MSIKRSIIVPLISTAAIGVLALSWIAYSSFSTYYENTRANATAVNSFLKVRDIEIKFDKLISLAEDVSNYDSIVDPDYVRTIYASLVTTLRGSMGWLENEHAAFGQGLPGDRQMAMMTSTLQREMEHWFNDVAIVIGLTHTDVLPTGGHMDQDVKNIQRNIRQLLAHTETRPRLTELQTRTSFRNTLIYTLIALIIIYGLGTLYAVNRSNQLISAIGRLQCSMGRLINGDYETPVSGKHRPDEIGDMARSVETFAQGLEQLQKAKRHIEHMALHDPLTSLANRRLLMEHLSRELERAEANDIRIAVLHIDLDKFKQINDTMGHAAGDVVLKEAARRMQEALRTSDLLARVGGDEFVVVAEEFKTRNQMDVLAGRLIETLCEPIQLDDQSAQIGASVGIAFYPMDGTTAQDLLMNADIALYHSKNTGRGRYTRSTKYLRENFNQREIILRELRESLAQNRIVPYFQPQVSLKTGEIVGFEALARWHHPERGVLTPAAFLEVANGSDVIELIGEAILDQSLEALTFWSGLGLPDIPLGVNVSVRELRLPDYAEKFALKLLKNKIPATRIVVEILETVMIENETDIVMQNFQKLVDLGVRLEVDDFGTGHSSLSLLQKFHVSRIKIDRCFVCDDQSDSKSRTLIQALIKLSYELEIECLVEGVETQAQLDYLRNTLADHVQGFYIAQPMTAADTSMWIEDYISCLDDNPKFAAVI